MLSHVGGPTQSQPSRPMSSGHHISMERQLWKKHQKLNSDTNASNETYLTEKKKKRKTHFVRKKGKMKKVKGKTWKQGHRQMGHSFPTLSSLSSLSTEVQT